MAVGCAIGSLASQLPQFFGGGCNLLQLTNPVGAGLSDRRIAAKGPESQPINPEKNTCTK
jgi:hypothetical protein